MTVKPDIESGCDARRASAGPLPLHYVDSKYLQGNVGIERELLFSPPAADTQSDVPSRHDARLSQRG